jgi:hypothetical protein
MSISSKQTAKISIITSILVIGSITVYLWQEYSSKMGLAVAVTLFLITVYEYKTKLAEIRMAYKYESR